MKSWFGNRTGPERDPLLDAAVEALRAETGADRISDSGRSQLYAAMRETEAPATFVSLLAKGYRWATVGAVPVLVLVAVVVLAGRQRPAHETVRLQVVKVGAEVVFTIANGARPHKVHKSSIPSEFDSAAEVRVEDGRFTDGVTAGADIVFYRID